MNCFWFIKRFSGFLRRRLSTPRSLQYGAPNSQNASNGDGITYTSCCRNRHLIGQHSLDHSSFNRFKEYKKGPRRCWSLDPDYIFPDMIGTSSILTNDEIIFLDDEKPVRLVGCTWELVFSTESHGYWLSSLYRSLNSWTGPTLLVIKDKRGHRFGAFVTESFKPDDKIHGGGECFVFRLKHDNMEKLFGDINAEPERQFSTDTQQHKNGNGLCSNSGSNLSQNTNLATLHDLILSEEHFSAEEDNDKAENNSNSLYSTTHSQDTALIKDNKLSTNSDISEHGKGQKHTTASKMSQKEIRKGRSCSWNDKQVEFLKQHDISDHYVWVWAQENSCFIHGDDQFLHIGLDDGKVALSIDNMLERGRSQHTRVFQNEPLAPSLSNKDGDFEIVTVEVWLFKQL